METVIIAIHLMVVIALVAVILLQKSEGGALGIGGGGGGGGGNFLSGRGTANVLTRTTTFLAFGFFMTSISLTLIASQSGGTRSILDGATISPNGAIEQPTGPSTTDDLLNQLPGGATEEPSGPQVPLSE